VSKLYAESSAVLSWLLGEQAGESIRRLLVSATEVLTSELTMLEVGRALLRHASTGGIDPPTHSRLKSILDQAAANWIKLAIDDAVLARAGQPFPVEPVRSLDAIHLASVSLANSSLGNITVMSLDQRVRNNAQALGLSIAPS